MPLTPTDCLPGSMTCSGSPTSGQGIEFDDTTTVGPLNRAWVFTEAWLGGGAARRPG